MPAFSSALCWPDWYNHHIDYDIFEPLFGFSFWKGNFYLWFSLVLWGTYYVCTHCSAASSRKRSTAI